MAKKAFILLGLFCLICGCGKNNTASPPLATPQTVTEPAAPPTIAAQPMPPKQKREVSSLESLLSQIPTNQFTVSDGGWDKFTMPKVQKWVSNNLYGKRTRLAVLALECTVAQDDVNPKPDEWIVRLRIPGVHGNYAGLGNRIFPIAVDGNFQSRLAEPMASTTFAFKCNEADARKWDAHCKESIAPAIVVGDITEVAFTPRLVGLFHNIPVGYDTVVTLANVTLAPSDDMEAISVYIPELIGHIRGSIREVQ